VRWVRWLPLVGAAVVLIAGGLVYQWAIPIHHVESSRLSRLVVTKPPAGFSAKPTSSAVVPTASVPFSAFKTAAKRSPHHSGAYDIQWPGQASSPTDAASVQVAWLPSRSEAAAVEKQAVTTDLGPGTFKADSYTLERRFMVAGVPGAEGALFGPTPSKGKQGVAVVVFPEGRYAVIDLVALASAPQARTEVTSLAEAENAHLQQVGPDFTLSVTHWPLEASLIFAVVTVALAALVVLVPVGVIRARRRQRSAREAAKKRAVQGRGRKIARHQAARSR
jgi:hypothetical protein